VTRLPLHPAAPLPSGPDRFVSPGGRPGRPSVWVVGGTGYSGLEAVRLLRTHPAFRLARIFASPGSPERDLAEIDPGLAPGQARALPWSPALLEEGAERPDAALLALPDEASADLAPRLLAHGIRVVDLSSVFRPKSAGAASPPTPGNDQDPVYGLTEWEAARIASARLVANPGCYATACLLALLPLERAGLLDPGEAVVVDGKSGITGAGRRLEADYLFAEANENCRPYSPLAHRHLPEIRAVLGLAAERPLLFVPHVLPVSRGLMTTVYVRLARGVASGEIAAAFDHAYAAAPAVRLLGSGRWPQLRGVTGTGRCDIGWTADPVQRAAVVVSALDNLLKGAAGQAVQNLNLLFGRPREEGIPL